jgi:hypothetical protein
MASIVSAGTTSATALNMSADTSGVLQLASNNGTVAVTVDSSQNVGIGTTSPSTGTLNKQLTINSGASALAGVVLQNNTTGTGSTDGTALYINSADAALINYEAGALSFGTSATERMRLTNDGYFLVGCTLLPASNRTKGFAARPNSQGGIQIYQTSAVSDWAINSTSGSICNFYSDNGTTLILSGQINVNGNATAYTSTASDYRLKENVTNYTGGLNAIASLRPVSFTWKESKQQDIGFIAHELQTIVPSSVVGEKDAVDENGKPQYQAIFPAPAQMIANLVAAIQEQQALITQLQADVAALKAGA